MITGSYSSRVPPFGYPRINSRSQIPVAFRSLLRPSSLPDAKASAVRPYYLDPYFFPSVVKEHCKLATKFAVISYWLKPTTNHQKLITIYGGGERDRTDDPLLAKQVLSQLSYTPT